MWVASEEVGKAGWGGGQGGLGGVSVTLFEFLLQGLKRN